MKSTSTTYISNLITLLEIQNRTLIRKENKGLPSGFARAGKYLVSAHVIRHVVKDDVFWRLQIDDVLKESCHAEFQFRSYTHSIVGG